MQCGDSKYVTVELDKRLHRISFSIRVSAVRVLWLLHRISLRCSPCNCLLGPLSRPDQRRRLWIRNNPTGSSSAKMSTRIKEGETFGPPLRATVWVRLWLSPTLGPKVSQTRLQRRSSGEDGFGQAPCDGLQPHLFFLLCRSIFFLFRIISYSFSRPACRP